MTFSRVPLISNKISNDVKKTILEISNKQGRKSP